MMISSRAGMYWLRSSLLLMNSMDAFTRSYSFRGWNSASKYLNRFCISGWTYWMMLNFTYKGKTSSINSLTTEYCISVNVNRTAPPWYKTFEYSYKVFDEGLTSGSIVQHQEGSQSSFLLHGCFISLQQLINCVSWCWYGNSKSGTQNTRCHPVESNQHIIVCYKSVAQNLIKSMNKIYLVIFNHI